MVFIHPIYNETRSTSSTEQNIHNHVAIANVDCFAFTMLYAWTNMIAVLAGDRYQSPSYNELLEVVVVKRRPI